MSGDRPFRAALWILAGSYAAFMLLPLLALLGNASPRYLLAALGQPELWYAVGLSVVASTAATLLAVAGGLPLAYLLHRRPGRLARLMTTLFELPLAIPPAVAGLALILAFGRYQMLGPTLARLGIGQLALTPAAVVMAQVLVASPLFFRAARTALAAVPPRLLSASAVLGAGEATTFRRVLLPLARHGLLSGALLTWARAVGELGATLMFAGTLPRRTLTMPTAIFVLWQEDLTGAVTLACLLLLLTSLALLAARRLAPEVLP